MVLFILKNKLQYKENAKNNLFVRISSHIRSDIIFSVCEKGR